MTGKITREKLQRSEKLHGVKYMASSMKTSKGNGYNKHGKIKLTL
jgi:hypothetical protein